MSDPIQQGGTTRLGNVCLGGPLHQRTFTVTAGQTRITYPGGHYVRMTEQTEDSQAIWRWEPTNEQLFPES